MNLNFPNITIVGLDQESRFFQAGFNYSNIQNITINGNILDLISSFGISGIWTGQEGIINTVKNNQNFESLTLNNVNFGSGRIQNISFDAGNDIKIKKYTANLLIYQTGNLTNFTGLYYSGIDISNFQYLDGFSENYSFVKKENGGYSYNHRADITFNSGIGNLNAIPAAKTLAKTLFTGFGLGFYFYSGYTSKIGKRFYSEVYNLINNSCSFDETFNFDVDSGNYSAIRINRFDINENGIIQVAEKGIIKGIVRPTYQQAINSLENEMNNAYERCSGIYNLYAPSNPYPLLIDPIVRGKTLDIFNNNIEYNLIFSNDISNSGIYFWNYTQQLNFSEGISKLIEDGQIRGRSQNRQMSYSNAINGFNIAKSSVANRSSNFYFNHIGNSNNFLESKEETYSPYRATINYSYRFSNENVLAGSSGVKKIDFQINDNYPVYYYSKIDIFNFKEIIQPNLNDTVGSRNMKLTLYGERVTPLSSYLSNALTQLNGNIPTGLDPYIENTNYTFNQNDNIVEVNQLWRYTVPANKTIQL